MESEYSSYSPERTDDIFSDMDDIDQPLIENSEPAFVADRMRKLRKENVCRLNTFHDSKNWMSSQLRLKLSMEYYLYTVVYIII